MYLNIPVKLESYVSVIKEQTRFLKDDDKITLLKLGTTKSDDTFKLMYLIYNPFPITMHFDCNSFSPVGKIYKIYPSNLAISPKTAYAFVAFVSNCEEITLNEDVIVKGLRQNISGRVQKLNSNFENEFEESRMFEVDPASVEVDKTVMLNPKNKSNEDDYIYTKYTPKFEEYVIVSLDSVDTFDNELKLNVKFQNKHEDLNFEMNGFRLKMEDYSSKIIINAKEKFNVKSQTTKIVSVYVNYKEFEKINLENMKIKITII